MGLLDEHIKAIVEKATQLNSNSVFNIYQLKGALPEKKCVDESGRVSLEPFTQKDIFVMFGVEEGDNSTEEVILTDQIGAPQDKIILTHIFNVKILFQGNEADFYSLKFKARMWSREVQQYLEDNKITILTKNPQVSFETEEEAGEFWNKRGIQFEAVIELHFDDTKTEELEILGDSVFHNINKKGDD